jgi:hypothetical protein
MATWLILTYRRLVCFPISSYGESHDPINTFALAQFVCDCACGVQTPSLILSPPLPSHRQYVIVLAECRPLHWSCHHHCLPTGSMWLCLQSADPFTDSVTTFAFPQRVCVCACRVQTPSLSPSPPLSSHRMCIIFITYWAFDLSFLSYFQWGFFFFSFLFYLCATIFNLVVSWVLFQLVCNFFTQISLH